MDIKPSSKKFAAVFLTLLLSLFAIINIGNTYVDFGTRDGNNAITDSVKTNLVDTTKIPLTDTNKVKVDSLEKVEDDYQTGEASWYGLGDGYHGKKTASGEIFNTYALTAAHRTLKFGTIVRVTNLKNGKWVDVKINDRGPFSKGRIIDLSYAAKNEIDMGGTAKVKLQIVKQTKNKK